MTISIFNPCDGRPMPPASFECVIILKFSPGFISTYANCRCICCKCLKKGDGILMGSACMQYKSLGRITILIIVAIPNHETPPECHFLMSEEMFF